MPTKIMKWVAITALVLAVTVTWPSSSNYQITMGLVVLAGSLMLVIALFPIRRRIKTHHDRVNHRSDLGEQVKVRL
jgi:membrane protein implicated in regulation of membrane protease activity